MEVPVPGRPKKRYTSPTRPSKGRIPPRSMRGLLALKEGLQDWVLSLPRYRPKVLKRHYSGPGVYVIFNHGEIFRVGSSCLHGPTRVVGQLSQIRGYIGFEIARAKSLPLESVCRTCGQRRGQSQELRAIVKSVRLDLRVAFIPRWALERMRMEVLQFEGLLLWALRPPANALGQEIAKLPRTDMAGLVNLDDSHEDFNDRNVVEWVKAR